MSWYLRFGLDEQERVVKCQELANKIMKNNLTDEDKLDLHDMLMSLSVDKEIYLG